MPLRRTYLEARRAIDICIYNDDRERVDDRNQYIDSDYFFEFVWDYSKLATATVPTAVRCAQQEAHRAISFDIAMIGNTSWFVARYNISARSIPWHDSVSNDLSHTRAYARVAIEVSVTTSIGIEFEDHQTTYMGFVHNSHYVDKCLYRHLVPVTSRMSTLITM